MSFSKLSNRGAFGYPLKFRSAGEAGLGANFGPIDKTGLVGWWDSRKSGDVAALGTWQDYSGNGNHGTLIGTANVDATGCVLGSGSAVNCGNGSSLNVAKITVSLWINKNAIGDAIVGKVTRGEWDDGFTLHTYESGGKIRFAVNNYTNYAETASVPTRLEWHHIVGTYDRQYIKIYLDGILSGTRAYTAEMFSNTANLTFGYMPTSYYMDGTIDDIQIYSRALGAAEILANYNRNKRA